MPCYLMIYLLKTQTSSFVNSHFLHHNYHKNWAMNSDEWIRNTDILNSSNKTIMETVSLCQTLETSILS